MGRDTTDDTLHEPKLSWIDVGVVGRVRHRLFHRKYGLPTGLGNLADLQQVDVLELDQIASHAPSSESGVGWEEVSLLLLS